MGPQGPNGAASSQTSVSTGTWAWQSDLDGNGDPSSYVFKWTWPDGKNAPFSLSMQSSPNRNMPNQLNGLLNANQPDPQPDDMTAWGYNCGQNTDPTKGHLCLLMESHYVDQSGMQQQEFHLTWGPPTAPPWNGDPDRRFLDLVGRENAPFDLTVGLVADDARLTPGRAIADYPAFQTLCGTYNAANPPGSTCSVGSATMQSTDQNHIIQAINGAKTPITFTVPGYGAPVMELCPAGVGSDGCHGGLNLRGDISSQAGATLHIGTPSVPFADVNVRKIVNLAPSPNNTVPPQSECGVGTVVTKGSDGSAPSITYQCRYAPVTGMSGYGAIWQAMGGWDLYGDGRGHTIGNGTFNIGDEVMSTYGYSAGGVYQLIHLYAVVIDLAQHVATATEVVASQFNFGAPLTGLTTLYRTTPANNNPGTGWTLSMTADSATGGIQPMLVVTDGETYEVRWKMTGVGITK
jgi:hypothetical protein